MQPKRCDASRREFDGQRDAIELTRNRSDQLKAFRARREVGVQCLCPGNQELHCAASEDIVISISALSRNIERGNAIDILAVDAKHLAARRQNRRIWTGSYERLRQPRSPFNQMLAIIQHEQEFSCSDFPRNRFKRNLVAALSKAENSRDRKWHQRRVRQRDQFDEQTVTSERREQIAGNRLREYGLPDTAGPGHGDHSIGRKQL